MAAEIVGREEELGGLQSVLDRYAEAPGLTAVAIDGEPGFGKTTLWSAAVAAVRERGWRVLLSRPAGSERALAHACLGDLFEDVLAEVLPRLTPARRRALESAVLVAGDDRGPVDPRALGVAVRDVLAILATGRVVIAIDDLQWVDASSAEALAFALRRLSHASILLIWTRRVREVGASIAVEDAIGVDRIVRLSVGALGPAEIQRIVQARLSRTLPRPTMTRLYEVSGGSPFYALELARTLVADGTAADPARPLPVPDRLEELVSDRLRRFAGPTRDALVLTAADGRLTTAGLTRLGIEPSVLDGAIDEQVVEVANGLVRFTHPLLASAFYQGLSGGERRRAHQRLAAVAGDPIARARHLALSTDVPDETLARTLERAALDAAQRGAPIAAAELGEHARRLTPLVDVAANVRRTVTTARAHLASGAAERARVLAGELMESVPAGAERALALALAAEIETEDLARAVSLLRASLREPMASPALLASSHLRLSLLLRFSEGLEAAERHARAACEVADGLDDRALRAAALGALAMIRFNAARPDAIRLAEEAAAIGADASSAPQADAGGFALAHVLVWSGQIDRARPLLESLLATWSERDERTASDALWYLALVELRAGRLARAEDYARRSSDLSAQYARDETESPQARVPMALVAASRGELARARALTTRIRDLTSSEGSRLSMPDAMLGVVELWSGDPQTAVARFAEAERLRDAPDRAEPGLSWWRAEQVEALLQCGLLDDAVSRLDAWEADGARLGREWVLAHATRCRGLVAAARGEVEQAIALLEDAAARHAGAGDPLGRGRALLALGTVRRRLRQKRAAREAITAALALFEECGAIGWSTSARTELGTIGGRRREEGLTAAERRVAMLVADGRTNREVAAALVLGEATVETHLSHIYAKLGVRSRTELARILRSRS